MFDISHNNLAEIYQDQLDNARIQYIVPWRYLPHGRPFVQNRAISLTKNNMTGSYVIRHYGSNTMTISEDNVVTYGRHAIYGVTTLASVTNTYGPCGIYVPQDGRSGYYVANTNQGLVGFEAGLQVDWNGNYVAGGSIARTPNTMSKEEKADRRAARKRIKKLTPAAKLDNLLRPRRKSSFYPASITLLHLEEMTDDKLTTLLAEVLFTGQELSIRPQYDEIGKTIKGSIPVEDLKPLTIEED